MPVPVGYAAVAASLKHVNDSEPWFITYGIAVDLSSFSALEHADAQHYAFTAGWAARMDSNVTIGPFTLRIGQDGGEDLIVDSQVTPTAGANSTKMVPQNVAALVKKNTGLGGRRNRGRCFMPGVVQGTSVNEVGVIDTGLVDLQNAADTWLDALELGAQGSTPLVPTPMVILHGTPEGVPAPTPTPVVSLTVDSLVATQRRRLRR